MTKLIAALALCLALVAPLAAADNAVGSGDANAASGAAQDAGGKAGTTTGTGQGTEGAQPTAKAAGNAQNAQAADVKLDALPAPVKSAVTKEASAQEVSSIRSRTADGKTVYDVEVKRGGHLETICFDDQGRRVDKAGAAKAQ